jgi:serine/threonine protein kinase
MTRPNDLLNGRYRVVRAVAKGGMGAVLEGVDERLNRAVAIKIVRPELVKDPVLRARFDREARAAAAISHPNVVQIYDLDVTADGTAFLVMEWMTGESFAGRLRNDGRFEPRRAAALVEQALRGLHVAHAAGIVHRDLKPGNLMLVEAGGVDLVKVVDFGIAQLKNGAEYTRLTMTGEIIGTPAFMPPEQLQGGEVTPAVDVYAMGVVLWCLLIGKVPFGSGADVIVRVLTTTPPRADAIDPMIPRAIADIAERAMQREPAARFASALEMADALRMARGAHPLATNAPTSAATPFALPAAPFAGGATTAVQSGPRTSSPSPAGPHSMPLPQQAFIAPGPAAMTPPSPSRFPLRAIAIAMACFVVLLATSAWWLFARRPSADAAAGQVSPAGGAHPGEPASVASARPVCERAAQCCRTYAAGINPGAIRACDGLAAPSLLVQPSAEATCHAAIDDYSRGLAAMGRTCDGAGPSASIVAPPSGVSPEASAAAAVCVEAYRCCVHAYPGDSNCTPFQAWAASPQTALQVRSSCERALSGFRGAAVAFGHPCEGAPPVPPRTRSAICARALRCCRAARHVTDGCEIYDDAQYPRDEATCSSGIETWRNFAAVHGEASVCN